MQWWCCKQVGALALSKFTQGLIVPQHQPAGTLEADDFHLHSTTLFVPPLHLGSLCLQHLACAVVLQVCEEAVELLVGAVFQGPSTAPPPASRTTGQASQIHNSTSEFPVFMFPGTVACVMMALGPGSIFKSTTP